MRRFPNGSESEQPIRNRARPKLLKTLERVKGIEPSYSAWKAAALPLSYTRDFNDLARLNFSLVSF
jgi:hypothetical protein